MSDHGDAGKWRPATSQNDLHSEPDDDTTGPLPAVSEDEDEAPGFPPVSSGPSAAADEDDSPAGGFPSGAPPEEPSSPAPASWSVFEPVDRKPSSSRPPSPQAHEPGPADPTPRFGTQVPEPEPSESFETKPYETQSHQAQSFDPSDGVPSPASSFGPPPKPEQAVTTEDEDAEDEFFAPDDQPPMWDKVVAPSGPPPKPGKPSSGNLRLPEWMRDEDSGGHYSGSPSDTTYADEGRSKRTLLIGLGILIAALVAAVGVYLLTSHDDSQASDTAAPSQRSQAPSRSPAGSTENRPAARKRLPRFQGVHTKALGRVSDTRSGLSYARFARPWALPAKDSPMNEIGFSASQFAVTEKAGAQPKHWARLMSGQLSGAAKGSYTGPGTEGAAAAEFAEVYETRVFGFPHRKRLLASQPLDIGGHKGWLISDYLKYHRPGVKATGDIMMVAVVDTGKNVPGVLLMTVPNTSRRLWPDLDFVVRSLQIV